jgi:hypothetical protein
MPATGEQMGAAIAPGSIEYGKKEQLVRALGGMMAGAPRNPRATTPAPPKGNRGGQAPGDLMGMLTGGALPPAGLPLTDGLSVGPGAGPVLQDASSIPSALEDRLRLVALNAKTPMMRAMARNALRRQVTRRLYDRG